MPMKNPFVVHSPENLSPQQIVDLFVEKYTEIETIKQRKHTLIWGSRGSGKSMMLKFLEPRCQAIKHGSLEEFLQQPDPFLAIYAPIKEGHVNKSELKLFNEYARLALSEHLLNLTVADNLIRFLKSQFPPTFFSKEEQLHFANTVASLFDRASIASSVESANTRVQQESDPLSWLTELFLSETTKVASFLRSAASRRGELAYEGATSGYHDFTLPLMKAVQGFGKFHDVPIFVMLDDDYRLFKEQQTIINSWIANRDQSTLCLKISAEPEGHKTFKTRDGGIIEQPHDYSEVNVDELYTSKSTMYEEKVREIAEKRLQLSVVPTKQIELLLPTDPHEDELLAELKKQVGDEWEKVGKPGPKNDYVTRLANARLFQLLKDTKQKKSYAGFRYLVHLSSGVIRDFLEPCYLMFDQYVSTGHNPQEISSIPPGLQNEVISRYSEDLLLTRMEDIRKSIPEESWPQLDTLQILLQSLGRLFYERLHDPQAREARMFSFTVRGPMTPELEEVLRLGTRYRYFQARTYSTKKGGGREKWYVLNRRLCPVYKLDPTGFEGRISISAELLVIACQDPEKFVQLRLKQPDDEDQPTLTSFGA